MFTGQPPAWMNSITVSIAISVDPFTSEAPRA